MICPKCGAASPDGTRFCQECGSPLPERAAAAAPQPTYAASYYRSEPSIPPEYKPLSPWAYFGLALLYAIPVLGFVFLIIYSFDDSNLNRRSFTRSYWCGLLVAVAVSVVILVLAAVFGVSLSRLQGYW